MVVNCDRWWSRLMSWSYKVRRKPVVTNSAPPRPDRSASA